VKPLLAALLVAAGACLAPAAETLVTPRKPKSEADLRYWLRNMIGYHGFTHAEAAAATGLTVDQIGRAVARSGIRPQEVPRRRPGDPLTVLPYPGGRHPRIGFLEGAVDPQRETKISVFAPWEGGGYVVADVPEAVWSNLGLTYLAHTHVPTLWSRQGITLEPLEWRRRRDGTLEIERRLPNGIRFGTRVRPGPDAVLLEMWLTNGTPEPLSDLRVQNCVMLKGAPGFTAQTNDNKRFRTPYAACRSDDGRRWVITAWEPCHRPWGNPPVPCLHSDPRFPDCPPGETRRLRGRLSFYEGTELEEELRRIDATGWRRRQ
jgi:hypothetical protein